MKKSKTKKRLHKLISQLKCCVFGHDFIIHTHFSDDAKLVKCGRCQVQYRVRDKGDIQFDVGIYGNADEYLKQLRAKEDKE